MHCKQLVAAALLSGVLLAGCSGESGSSVDQAPGEAAYRRSCAGCHGTEGQGRSPTFPPLAESEWLALPPRALTTLILMGLRGEIEVAGQSYAGYMPPMQHIDDEKVAGIVTYIKRRWSSGSPSWTAADVARVRATVAGKGALEGRAGLDDLIAGLK